MNKEQFEHYCKTRFGSLEAGIPDNYLTATQRWEGLPCDAAPWLQMNKEERISFVLNWLNQSGKAKKLF